MEIIYKDKKTKVYSDNSYDQLSTYSLQRRCQAYQTDEPETVNWLSSFTDDAVFFDVGSNVGGYSFMANMAHQSIKIYSFEANFMNFYTQIKTCKENNITNVYPINIAINNNNTFNLLKSFTIGNGGDGSFGDELKDEISNSKFSNPFNKGPKLEVGMLGITLDSLVYDFKLEIPNYIKIDVDGNELLVLKGAQKLLGEQSLKEIFIEIDDEIYKNNEIENLIKSYAFTMTKNIDVGTKDKPIRMALFTR